MKSTQNKCWLNTLLRKNLQKKSGRKTITLVRDLEHFMPTKFHKYPSIGSVGKADCGFSYIYTGQMF